MSADQLRQVRDAHPFVPFILHTVTGRTFRVPHRDYLSVAPSGRMVTVYLENGAANILDLLLINEIELDPGRPAEPTPEPAAAAD